MGLGVNSLFTEDRSKFYMYVVVHFPYLLLCVHTCRRRPKSVLLVASALRAPIVVRRSALPFTLALACEDCAEIFTAGGGWE